MRSFDFYEFVGIIVPGSVLMLALGILFPDTVLVNILTPATAGATGTHLVLAYLIGHFLQAGGNLLEKMYWALWGGMPTDWPITRPEQGTFIQARESVFQMTHEGNKGINEKEWQRLVARVRATIYAKGRAGRLQFFNGTYGMFRGIITACILITFIAWLSPLNPALIYPVLLSILIMSLYRMHRFAMHYAKELFANIEGLVNDNDVQSRG